MKGEEKMEEQMIQKCMEWFDNDIDIKSIIPIIKEDEEFWHRRIYLVAWNDDDGFTHVYIIRIWTMDNGKAIKLSEDYCNCVKIEDFISIIPDLVKRIY